MITACREDVCGMRPIHSYQAAALRGALICESRIPVPRLPPRQLLGEPMSRKPEVFDKDGECVLTLLVRAPGGGDAERLRAAGECFEMRAVPEKAGRAGGDDCDAAVAALGAFKAKRIGLLTPFDMNGNRNARKIFTALGFEVVSTFGFACANALHIAHVPTASHQNRIKSPRSASVARVPALDGHLRFWWWHQVWRGGS